MGRFLNFKLKDFTQTKAVYQKYFQGQNNCEYNKVEEIDGRMSSSTMSDNDMIRDE